MPVRNRHCKQKKFSTCRTVHTTSSKNQQDATQGLIPEMQYLGGVHRTDYLLTVNKKKS
jgi:hypothetical protein